MNGLTVLGTVANETSTGAGLWLQSEATAVISDARWSDNALAAIRVRSDATLDLSDAEIEGLPTPEPGLTYYGVAVTGAAAALTRVDIGRMQPYGLYVDDAGSMSIDQVTVTDVTMQDDGSSAGVVLFQGATLSGSQLVVERCEVVGLFAESSAVTLDQVMIGEITVPSGMTTAVGAAFSSSTGTLSELDVSAVEGAGVTVDFESDLVLADCTIHDLPAWDQDGSKGIEVAGESSLLATDCVLSDIAGVGLVMSGGADVELDTVSILRIDPYNGDLPGVGLITGTLEEGDVDPIPSTLHATDLLISQATGSGISFVATDATLIRTEVSGTLPMADGTFGYGISVDYDSTLEAEDLEISDVYGLGLGIFEGSASLDGLTIRDIHNAPESHVGIGLDVEMGGDLVASDVLIEDTEGPGLIVGADGSSLQCIGCTIRRTQHAGVILVGRASLALTGGTIIEDTTNNAGLGGGVGVLAADQPQYSGAPSLYMEDVTVTGSALAAVYIDGPGDYEIRDSYLEGGQSISIPELHPWGDAVFATATPGDEQSILLSGNTLLNAAGAGLFLDYCTATLDENTWEDNTLDLFQQGCDETEAPVGEEESARWERCPTYDRRIERLEYYVYVTSLDVE